MEPLIVASAYLQAGVGLNEVNLRILSTLAQWQEQLQLPVLAGGDFNVPPHSLGRTDFPARSGMMIVSPGVPTYKTAAVATELDYFVATRCLAERMQRPKLYDSIPLAPHTVVGTSIGIGQADKVPVLELPSRLPLVEPFGPRREAKDWTALHDRIREGHQYLERYQTSQPERLQVLDQLYAHFVLLFEQHICERTDTAPRRRSGRGRVPRIRWVESEARGKQHFKSWHTLERPLHWLVRWIQDVLRHLESQEAADGTMEALSAALEDCPSEFHSLPPLIELHRRGRALVAALLRDDAQGLTCPELNRAAFRSLLADAEQVVDQERRITKKGTLEAWRSWVTEAGLSRKGWAYKWTALKEPWRPTKTQPGAVYAGKPLDVLTDERKRLTEVWNCSQTRQPWFEAPEGSHLTLPQLDVEAALKVSQTFPKGTAQTFDGFHPRHYGMMEYSQMAAFLDLLSFMEAVGLAPSVLQAVLAKLIPKHKAECVERISMRGIGLMPSLYRFWARLRQPVARRWEADHKTPLLAHQAGRSIMEVVFLQSLKAESGQMQDGHRMHTGAFLWDLSNYYGHLDRQLLWSRASSTEFPLAIVAVALNQYAARRFVGLDALTVDAGFPEKGITAGCGLATYWIQVYSFEPLGAWQIVHPQVPLSMFIDDLMGQTEDAHQHRVVGRLAAAAASLHDVIDRELRCTVAQHKSALIASSDPLLERLKKAFGRFGGEAKSSAPNLGVDFFAGRRRALKKSVVVLRKREDRFLKRARRLQTLRRSGYDMRELFITGLQSFSHYGSEVIGLDTRQLQRARARYMELVGTKAPSAKANLTLAVMGDPLWRQGLGPALTWATIVWKATTSTDYASVISVPELGRLAGPVMVKAPRTWGAVRGPLGAAVMSLQRVGWRFHNSLTLIFDTGERFPLPSTSPALLAYHLQVSWKRKLGRSAAKSIGMEGEQLDTTVFQQHQRRSQHGQSLPLLKAFLTQGVWSSHRLKMAGYDIESSCPHCGAERDTLGHRLFVCPATEDLREEIFDSDVLTRAMHSPARRHLLLGFQLLPPPLSSPPAGLGHEQFEAWTRNGEPIEEVLEGEVFTDGSCTKLGPITWHRTGWSVVKVSQSGILQGYIRGVVGSGLPQTSPASEHVACLAAAAAPGGQVSCALSDYKGLEHLEAKAPWTVYNRQQIYAGVKLQIRGKAPNDFKVEKVKGHARVEEASTEREKYLAVGNDYADRTAKAAADQQPQPTAHQLQEYQFQIAFLRQYLAYIPRALARWPAVGPALGKKPLPRRERGHRGQASRGGQASFLADVLGDLQLGSTQLQLPEPIGALQEPALAPLDQEAGGASTADGSEHAEPQEQSDQNRTPGGPQSSQVSAPPQEDATVEEHEWVQVSQVSRRWACRSCMTTSRATFPPRGKCLGLALSLADIVRDPRGHVLQIAPYSDRSSVLIICSKCGHFAGSNRRNTKLHSSPCRRAFGSDGAKYAYKRVCEGKHPTYSRGGAKKMEPCLDASALVAPTLGGAAGPDSQPPT